MLAMASCRKEKTIVKSFTVTVQNVSTPGLINTPIAMIAVPLSPGAWAVFTGNDPMFTEGQKADIGTERIAEDGATGTKDAAMGALSNVPTHGVFKTAAGPLMPGESAQFTFNASQVRGCSFKPCLYNPMIGFIVLAVEQVCNFIVVKLR